MIILKRLQLGKDRLICCVYGKKVQYITPLQWQLFHKLFTLVFEVPELGFRS